MKEVKTNKDKRQCLEAIAIHTLDIILFSEKAFKFNFHSGSIDYRDSGNQMMLIAKTKWVIHRMTQADEILCGYAAVNALEYFQKNSRKKLHFYRGRT